MTLWEKWAAVPDKEKRPLTIAGCLIVCVLVFGVMSALPFVWGALSILWVRDNFNRD